MQNPMEIPHWDGLTVKDFCDTIGVSHDLHETLRAIYKYNVAAVSVWIGGKLIEPDTSTDGIVPEDAIEKLLVYGIAGDGSDWERGEWVSGNDDPKVVMENLDAARQRFDDALADYEAEQGFDDFDDDFNNDDNVWQDHTEEGKRFLGIRKARLDVKRPAWLVLCAVTAAEGIVNFMLMGFYVAEWRADLLFSEWMDNQSTR